MPRLAPFASLFAAVATLNVGMFVRLRAEHRARGAGLRTELVGARGGLALTDERLARVAAALSEHGQRMGGLEAGQAEVRGELTAANERMARVEETVAGALGRPFPERMAQAPEPETGADGRSATRRRRARPDMGRMRPQLACCSVLARFAGRRAAYRVEAGHAGALAGAGGWLARISHGFGRIWVLSAI